MDKFLHTYISTVHHSIMFIHSTGSVSFTDRRPFALQWRERKNNNGGLDMTRRRQSRLSLAAVVSSARGWTRRIRKAAERARPISIIALRLSLVLKVRKAVAFLAPLQLLHRSSLDLLGMALYLVNWSAVALTLREAMWNGWTLRNARWLDAFNAENLKQGVWRKQNSEKSSASR